MEYLDIYDAYGNHLGKEERSIVHRDGLWHKTVHCWLYETNGNIFFQIRKEEGKLYTTASGHVMAGESLTEGFEREIKEEIGIHIDASDATLVSVIPFLMDREKKDGSVFRDRAFANVYVDVYEGDYQDFCLDPEEVSGLFLVNAREVYAMMKHGNGSVEGYLITCGEGKNNVEKKTFDFSDFLVNPHETAIGKYGEVLEKVIALTK